MPDLTPLTAEYLAGCRELVDRYGLDLPPNIARKVIAQAERVAAAEQEVAALRDLVQGLVTHADIAVNSSEWYGPDDRIRAEALIEAAKAHLRGDVANPPAGGAS